MNAPTCKVELTYQDREGNKANVMFHLPFSTPPAIAAAAANAMISLLSGISDAVCVRFALRWNVTIDAPPIPALTSNVKRKAALFYTNEVEYEAIWIPSPKTEYTEQEGSLVLVRFDVGNPQVAGVLQAITAALSVTVTPENTPFPPLFVAGGIAL